MPVRRFRSMLTPLVLALSAALPFAAPAVGAERGDKRPNLVFVFSDQHSADMLGCYGNRDIITPNFDRLATQGVRFNHCISNNPLCTPYRGILLTGQHPLRCGAITNDVRIVPGHGKYFGEVLRDAGYRTGWYGKWHLYGGERKRPVPPGPYRYGFDYEFLTNNCTLLFDAKRAYYWDENGEKQLYGDWEPYAQTRQALDFIDRHADEPFALFLSWHPPHNWQKMTGYDAPEDCMKRYENRQVHLRPTVRDTPVARQVYRDHMAMITSLDRCIGWLTDKLEDRHLADNTLLVFTSDHGDLLLSYDWPRHKGRPEQPSCRVPLLIRYPGRLEPRASDLLVGTFDLMPTILGMMDLPIPDTCEGRDLTSAIVEGRDDAVDSQPLMMMSTNWRGIYTPRYTYSYSIEDASRAGEATTIPIGYNRLYDRREDPGETRNLYDSPEHADLRERLHRRTLEWMKRFGDTGLTGQEILTRSIREEDRADVLDEPRNRPQGWDGRFKGPPIEYLE